MERGRTASGLAYVSSDKIKVIKKNVAANSFIRLPEYISTEDCCILTNPDNKNIEDSKYKHKILSVLGHCRLKTKGTELFHLNNHPIIRDNVVGTHNGCICNDDDLFDKFKTSFGRYGEVDSEIIFALIDHYSEDSPIHIAIQRMSRIVSGSMACAMVHRNHPHVIWLFRRRVHRDNQMF
jgi:glucosamine 6-phosphate synthetase-like amidotransferase/phosphosugar isomerase protein